MRDLVVILLFVLVATGVALWVLQWGSAARTPTGGASQLPPPPKGDLGRASAPVASDPAPGSNAQNAGGTGQALLEFDSPPWAVILTAPEVMIGRHSQDDVRIPDVRVSRHHARLIAGRHGGFEIHNLTAARSEPNPMLVNGEECERASLGDGDVVTLGGVSFKLRLAA
jgi:hypothetical protein